MRHRARWVVLALAVMAAPAWAHRVRVFAVAQGAKVLCRGYFGRGGVPKNCPITVLLPNGAILAQGRTDAKGEFTFEATKRADLKIVLSAGSGHQAEYTLKAEELPADLPPAGAPAKPVPETATPAKPKPDAPARIAIGEQAIQRIVRQAVQEETLALRGEIRKLQDRGPGVTEVVGGIGYIAGIVGLVTYFRSRRQREAP